jgi:5-methylcytosine-specific restriction endonuclease McrA
MSVELSRIRDDENGLEVFPTDQLLDRMGEVMTVEHIEKAILDTHDSSANASGVFRSKQVAAILGLLEDSYTEQSVGQLELDHIYPKSKVDTYETATGESVDVHRIGNLQLLEKDVNHAKGDKLPLEWFDDLTEPEKEKYRRINFFPEIEPFPENFNEFVEARERRIREYLATEYVSRSTDAVRPEATAED